MVNEPVKLHSIQVATYFCWTALIHGMELSLWSLFTQSRPHSRKSLLSTRLYIRCLKKKIPLGDPQVHWAASLMPVPGTRRPRWTPAVATRRTGPGGQTAKGLLFVNQEQQGELNPSARDRLAGGGRQGSQAVGAQGLLAKAGYFFCSGRGEDGGRLEPGCPRAAHDPRVKGSPVCAPASPWQQGLLLPRPLRPEWPPPQPGTRPLASPRDITQLRGSLQDASRDPAPPPRPRSAPPGPGGPRSLPRSSSRSHPLRPRGRAPPPGAPGPPATHV